MKTVTTHLADLTIENPIDAYSDGMTQNITGVKNTDYGIDYVNSTSATTGVVETMDLSLETNTITTETVSTDGATTGINGITDKKGATETQTITSPSTSSTVSTSDNVTVGGTGNTTTSTVNTTVTTGSSSDETFSAGSMQSSSFSMSGTSGNSQMGSKSSSTISSDSSGTINNLDFGNMKVTLSATDNSGNIMQYEVDANEYAKGLKKNGLTNLDIVRIINGEISLEELLSEIENDSNRDRMRLLLEASYLNQFTSLGEIEVTNGSSLTNLEELKTESNEILLELQGLVQEKEKASSVSETEAIIKIITRLKMGESLEDILETEIIAWEYVDENGIKNYVFSDPYLDGNYNGEIQYKVLHFEDIYNNSDLLNELKSVLDKQEYNNFLFGEYTVTTWTDTDEQIELFYKIEEIYGKELMEVESTQKVLDEKILELQEKYNMYESIYEYINSEIDYYLKFVEPYILKENFESNSSFNLEVIDTLEEIVKKQQELYIASNGNSSIIYLDDNNVTDFIICLVNGEGNMENGSIKVEDRMFGISSTMYEHYVEWLPYINDTEKQIINYIYNTEGKEAAFNYLQEFSDVLDKRWLNAKIRKDQEFASKNWFNAIVASLGSIVVTPFEGINAAVYSLRAVALNEKLRRTDVYSSGDIWRQQVSIDIANHSKFWSFMYNTGMSMADTGLLIGANVITGGSASLVLSTTLMGSRAYVSTLNDALDRNLSDGTAITLAFASAATESLMENYSVGHLMNLENAFGGAASKIINKMALSPNNSLFMTKTAYAALGAVFQGICEGEEEFATEILNYVIDNLLSEDKSNRELTINNYVKMGYSLEEATQKADVDFANQVFQAFSGGFISGLFFGGHQSLKTSRYVSNQMALEMINSYNMSDTQKYAAGIELARLQKLAMEEQQQKEQKQKRVRLLEYARAMFNNVALSDKQMEQFHQDFAPSMPELNEQVQIQALNTNSLDNTVKNFKNYVSGKIETGLSLIRTTLTNATQKISLKLDSNLYAKYQEFVNEYNIEPYYFLFDEKYESLLYGEQFNELGEFFYGYDVEIIEKLMNYDMKSVRIILDFALKNSFGKSYLELYDDYSFFLDENTVNLFYRDSDFVSQKIISKILTNDKLLDLYTSMSNISIQTFERLLNTLPLELIEKIPNNKNVNDILNFYFFKHLNENIELTDDIINEYFNNDKFRDLVERSSKTRNYQNVEQYIKICVEKSATEGVTSKFLYLLSRNDELLITLDFRLLDEKYDSIPIEYIEKFALYSDIQNILINLDDKKLAIISRIINIINNESIDVTGIIYKALINIENSEFSPLLNSIIVGELNDEQVKNLILLLQKANNLYGIMDANELNNVTFDELRIEYFRVIEEQISDKTIKLMDLKNAIFEKKLGISYSDARFIYDRYYIDNLSQSDLSNEFVNIIEYIKNVIETYNKTNLINNYYKIGQSIATTDYTSFFNLEALIREEYANMYKDTLYQLDQTQLSTNPILQNITYNGTAIQFHEINGDFKLLIHALGAYNPSYQVPNNFKEDWTRPQIAYHGVSTSYISNDQIASARAKHPILGFANFDSKYFLLAGNYDLVSKEVIRNYDVSSAKAYRILPPKSMIDLTRHNHNEVVLERITDFKLIPDYIIYIVDSMDNRDNFSYDNQLFQETIQAAADFGLPVLIVDRLAYAKQEMEICIQLLEDYKQTMDISKIEELFIKLTNNNVGCRNFNENEILPYQQIFSNDSVKQIYDELIEFIKNNSDVGASLEALEKLESLLKNEELKYINVDAKPPFDFKVALNDIIDLKKVKVSTPQVDIQDMDIKFESPTISVDTSKFADFIEIQKEVNPEERKYEEYLSMIINGLSFEVTYPWLIYANTLKYGAYRNKVNFEIDLMNLMSEEQKKAYKKSKEAYYSLPQTITIDTNETQIDIYSEEFLKQVVEKLPNKEMYFGEIYFKTLEAQTGYKDQINFDFYEEKIMSLMTEEQKQKYKVSKSTFLRLINQEVFKAIKKTANETDKNILSIDKLSLSISRSGINQVLRDVVNPIENNINLKKIIRKTLLVIQRLINDSNFDMDVILNAEYEFYTPYVSLNTQESKALPSEFMVKKYIEKFGRDIRDGILKGYLNRSQGNYFNHIIKGEQFKVKHRLYLNIDNMDDTIDFVIKFANECEKIGIPFYFKTAYFLDGIDKIDKMMLSRDESVVIYASDEYLNDYVNICNKIVKDSNLKINHPPALTGIIDQYIGYGSEWDEGQSYNQLRGHVISNAITKSTIEMMQQHGIIDINEFIGNLENLLENNEYIELIKNNIEKSELAEKYDIDQKTFALSKEAAKQLYEEDIIIKIQQAIAANNLEELDLNSISREKLQIKNANGVSLLMQIVSYFETKIINNDYKNIDWSKISSEILLGLTSKKDNMLVGFAIDKLGFYTYEFLKQVESKIPKKLYKSISDFAYQNYSIDDAKVKKEAAVVYALNGNFDFIDETISGDILRQVLTIEGQTKTLLEHYIDKFSDISIDKIKLFEIAKLNANINVESSSDYFGKQTYSFGVNQNAIEELMIFAKDKEKHPRAAKVFEKLVNVIRQSNSEISIEDIRQILENANSKNGGICSYGAFTTAIVDYARNNNKFRQALEEKLNLTLFDNNGNINWLGATELMARIYIHAMVTNESIIVKDGKYDITAQSKSVFTNNRVTEFFKSIGFEANELLQTQFVITNVNDFRDTIQYNLDKGNILVLNLSPINKDSGIQFNITELNGEKWSGSIDASHVAYITAIDENGIETASWSYRAYITFEELQKCNFSLTRLNFDDIQVEQVKTIMQEAEIKNMTESNLQSSQSKTNTLNELENNSLNSSLIDTEDDIKAYLNYTEYDSNFDEKLEKGITLTKQGIVNGQNNILARINTNYIINKVNSYINGFINKKESSLPKSLQNNKLALTQLINNELFTSLPRKNQFSILKQFSTSVLNNIDVLKLFPELTVHNSELINLNKDNLDLALAILRSYNILGLQKIQLIADFNENVVENTMLQELLITQIQGIVEYGEIPNNLKNSKNFAQLLLQSNEGDSRKKSMLFRTFNKELQKQLVTEGNMDAINYADSDILFSRIDNKSAIEIALENNPILLEMILSSTDFSDFFKGYIKSHLSDEILSNPKIIQLLIERPTILKLLNTVPYILQNNFNLAKSMLNSEQLSYFDKTSLFSKFSEDIQIQLIMEGNIFAVSHADVDLLKMEMEDSKTLLENSLENNPNLLEQIWNSSDIYPIAKKNFILEFGYEPSIKHKVASIITQSPQYLFVFNALPLFLRNDYNLALSVLSSEKINLSDKKKIFSNFSKNIQKQLILEGNIEAISYASQEILEQKIGGKTLLETVLEQNSDLLQKIMISEQFSKLIFPKLNENLQEQLILEGNVHAVSLASIDLLKKKTDGKTLLQIAIEQNPDLKNINIPAMVIDEEIFKIYSQYGKIAINKQQVSQIYSDYISIMNNDNSSNQSLVLLLGNSLLNSIMNGNLQSLFILKNLVELKKNNPDLHIKLDTETNECFWQGAIQEISIGTLHSKWQDTGTIKHELGHLLFDMILNNELPNNWESIVNNARIWSSNKVGNVFLNRIQELFKEINSNAYDSAYKNFEQQVKTWGFMSVNEYRSALIRKYKTLNYELDNIIKYMKLAGYKSDTIAAISRGNYTAVQLADISIKSFIAIEKNRILYTSYSEYLAISDIIDAVFKGTGRNLNNYSLYFVGKHGEKYYNTGLDNLPFHEIIANFTQLKISNNNELLEWISLIFGDEFYNCLNNTYNKFIAINSNNSSPRNHINVNSSNVEIITLETHKNSSETSIDFDSASIMLNSPNVTIYQKREYFSKIPEQIKIDLINAGNLTAILLSSDELLLTKDETQDKCLWEIALINSNKFLDTFIEHTEIGDLNENSYQKIKYSGKSLILNVPRLRNGGHLRSGLMRLRKISEYVKSELKKNGFDYHKLQLDYEYHEVYKYPNGVSVGYYPFHEQKIKRSGINQTYFPETWTNLDIFRAALTILTNENIDNYEDGQTIFGYYKGVKVGIILTNRRIATIFPNNFNQPDDDSIIELETKISHLKQKNVYEQINESEKDIIYIYKNIGGTREILETRKITLKERK